VHLIFQLTQEYWGQSTSLNVTRKIGQVDASSPIRQFGSE